LIYAPIAGRIPRVRFALFLAVFSCTNPARQEARSLVEAVDRYHKAENPEKPAAADALEKVACTDEEVCAAKEACTKAAAAMANGLRKQEHAAGAINAMSDGSLAKNDPSVLAAALEVEEADQLMRQGNDAMPACDDKIAALRVKLR
jgi:hypothetical protein